MHGNVFTVLLNRKKNMFYNNEQEAILTIVTTVFHQWYVINTEQASCGNTISLRHQLKMYQQPIARTRLTSINADWLLLDTTKIGHSVVLPTQ